MPGGDAGRPVPDLSRPRSIHVAGIGGTGMSFISVLLQEMGHSVAGTDAVDGAKLEALRRRGIEARAPHGPVSVGTDLLARSTAVSDENPDVISARETGVPVLSRADILAAICSTARPVAVAGAHGKTTTSGLLATIVDELDPTGSFGLGAEITHLGTNARWRGPGLLVVEADESDGTFLRLDPAAAIVTNVEADHLSYWGTEAALVDGYHRFVAGVAGPVVLCADDPGSAALVPSTDRPVTYGVDPAADYRIVDARFDGLSTTFRLESAGPTVDVAVAAPGLHNARNAAGALGMAAELGFDLGAAAEALARFRGVARRFEDRGEAAGVRFVDSYDHLPTEAAAALAAARAGGWARTVCVFQPHRYTRTRDLAGEFASAFVEADRLVVTDIYGHSEVPIDGVSGMDIVRAVLDAHPDAHCTYMPTLDDVERYLLDVLRPGDLCLTLNAGDLTAMPDRLKAQLG